MDTIKTFIFDFGDVLVTDTNRTFREKYGFKNWPKSMQSYYANAFHDSERGIIPTSKLLKIINRCCPQISPEQIEKHMVTNKILPPYKLYLKLKKHYQIFIFTNNQKSWPRKIAKKLNLDLKGTKIINSAYVGFKKPDLGIYKILLNKYHLNPKETIYIDDKKRNLDPAKALGFKTYLYKKDDAKLIKFLKLHKVIIK